MSNHIRFTNKTQSKESPLKIARIADLLQRLNIAVYAGVVTRLWAIVIVFLIGTLWFGFGMLDVIWLRLPLMFMLSGVATLLLLQPIIYRLMSRSNMFRYILILHLAIIIVAQVIVLWQQGGLVDATGYVINQTLAPFLQDLFAYGLAALTVTAYSRFKEWI